MDREELTLADLPDEDASLDDLLEFAGSFDGYRAAGGFHECATIAQAPKEDSITEQRIAMFFSARARRHCGDDFEADDLAVFRDYVAKMREILLKRG